MADDLSFQVRGLSTLLSAIMLLPPKMRSRVLRPALRAGAKVIKQEIDARAPRLSGATAASVRIVPRRGSRQLVKLSIEVGNLTPRQRQRFERNTAFYVRFIEQGTVKMAAKPFVRPAVDAAGEAAFAATVDTASEKMDGVI